MKRILIATAAMFVLAAPAFASSCPKHVKAIDAYLMSTQSVDAEKAKTAKMLRDEGQKLHEEGKHDASMAKLMEAEKLLGMPMSY
jgi:hypothetical protein